MRLPRSILALFLLCLAVAPASGDAVETALNDAIAAFEQASPHLGAETFGVELAAYRDALTLGRFTSRYWGQALVLALDRGSNAGGCARFAAYVSLPPRNGQVSLSICPQFSSEGTRQLRRLTILHEMVHVVAGPDECRAMAFAAEVEHAATGAHTPVGRYWQANNCDRSGFTLP